MPNAALIVAAGRGLRAGWRNALPKQYIEVSGRPLLSHVICAFEAHAGISQILTVIHEDDRAAYEIAASKSGAGKLLTPVLGGSTRQQSVHAGLEALAQGAAPDHVLIHDAARPFVTGDVIGRVLTALGNARAAIPALPLRDTLKRQNDAGGVAETMERTGLWQAQTPQGFDFALILDGHRRAANSARQDFTDDAAIAEWLGTDVVLVEGSPRNAKITTDEDLAMALATAQSGSKPSIARVGSGLDVHRFCPGDHVWLCGVRIPHTHSLEGHSDADVALHAVTDAILGAIADGDIGQRFPPADPCWHGAPSSIFVEDARQRVARLGGHISNVDVTLMCEAPLIGPHRGPMREKVAQLLRLPLTAVNVKATTTEGLGFTGRREGIAALAMVLVVLPC